MKKYVNIKVELISFGAQDIILTSQLDPIVYGNGAIDGELDYATEASK